MKELRMSSYNHIKGKIKYSMFIGRFQPWHTGHKWIVDQRLKRGKNICIAVMDIHGIDPENNPYTTHEVIYNISNALSEEIKNNRIKIISIPAIESINYGRTVGYDIIEHNPPEEIKNVSSTIIRNSK